MKCLLAVDGGGTKTAVVAFDPSGRIQAQGTFGPSNLQNLGEERCGQVLANAVEIVLRQAGSEPDEIEAACLGLGGLDTDEDLAAYTRIARRIFGSAAVRVQLENDGFIAIHAGTLGGPGIALIAGTGSMAVGVNERGERARSGGWGALFGDEGSAYDVGRQAIVRALHAMDGRGPSTALVAAIEARFGMPLMAVVARLYRDPSPQTAVASLAETVHAVAEAGDPVARDLLHEAARHLASCVDAVLKQLTFAKHPVPVVLSGGLFRSSMVTESVTAELLARGDVQSVRPALPPIGGACILALLKAGVPVTGEVMAALREGLVESELGG
ncbi:N-acetylglucosamine kinase [Limnochorda pilosa]|uniref:N-acetylglucosamine kinase n=1 Tax=Limnochorda pilosa TaxID=1555112 RepID=UPI0026F30D1A|nr:BadF/BadG/BcrA/BcrD ATPase family protein [Limnochorda pilosa]